MSTGTTVHEFDLRYGDRVLAFHAYVNTDRDPSTTGREIRRATRSRKLDAQACWVEGYGDGAEIWAAMLKERNVQNDSVLQYGSRIFVFHMFMNTEEDPYHIHKTILRIARGPRLDACVVWAEIYEGENGRKVWSVVQKATVATLSQPNASPFDASPAVEASPEPKKAP